MIESRCGILCGQCAYRESAGLQGLREHRQTLLGRDLSRKKLL